MADEESEESPESEEDTAAEAKASEPDEEESAADEEPDEEASDDEETDSEDDDEEDEEEFDDADLDDDKLTAAEAAALDEDIDDRDLDEDEQEDLDALDEELDDDEQDNPEIGIGYQPLDEKTQRRAGWGCLVLLVFGVYGAWYGVQYLIGQALTLDQDGVPADYLEAARNDALPQRSVDAGPPDTGVRWSTDYEAALREAEALDVPVILFLEASATTSQDMFQGTFLNRGVQQLLREMIPVRIDVGDAEMNHPLVVKYGVESLPTVLYLTPEEERLRPDNAQLVDAADMEVYLTEALSNYRDARIYE